MKAIELLMNEHRVIERALTLLELATMRIKREEKVSINALNTLLKFFREYADRCHHGKEENSLFPLLEAKGIPREGGPIEVMLYEHQLGRGYIKAMIESLESLDKNIEAKAKFINNALSYITMLRDHIYKEDNILFRIAEEVINESDNIKLLREFEDIEVNRLGPMIHEQLIKSLDSIENLLKLSKN